jgi:hypothetical protein
MKISYKKFKKNGTNVAIVSAIDLEASEEGNQEKSRTIFIP